MLFPKRNVFDLTHERKFSCYMGKLIPIMCEEVLPGDTWKVKTDSLLRLSPLLAPVMHRINVFTHFFFVPNRLLWTNWEPFITGGVSGTDATVAPFIEFSGSPAVATGSLADYFGLPCGWASAPSYVKASALPFRAYNLIYNQWYRDQNLQTEIAISKGDGADVTTAVNLLSRNWEKDYFTSSLPWAQRGLPVEVPVGGSADVTIPSGFNTQLEVGTYQTSNSFVGGQTYSASGGNWAAKSDPGEYSRTIELHGAGYDDKDLHGTADLSTATNIAINTLRQAFQIQKWMERNARAGVRYVESILSHFGVRSSDARLQRAEFLGGGKSPFVISEVLQTSATDDSITDYTPLGTMAGHGLSAQRSSEFKKSFEEHGYIIGIMSIMPRTSYQQGLNRAWSRETRYDYYWPEFANLGEQAVLNKELYYVGSSSPDNGIFGYQGRYDEYRRRESTVHGDFRSSLNFWHMGRIFSSLPTLDGTFVTCDPTMRIQAVTSEHNCWVQLINSVKAIRPLPKRGEPGLIDHN